MLMFMDAKHERWEAIRKIVQSAEVSTQANLRKALRDRGMIVDQSTLSRDLVEMDIRKAGGRYVIHTVDDESRMERVDLSAAVLSFTTCGPHLLVIRTATGQAQGVASLIDHHAEPAILATIAGDDAIFVATKTRRTQVVALRRLEQWFGEKHER